MENRPWSRRRSFSRNVPTARNMAFTVTENPLVLLSLPRHERYKFENIIVAGILPGPSEPKLTANTFLEPLVRELQAPWACKHRFAVHGSLFKPPDKSWPHLCFF